MTSSVPELEAEIAAFREAYEKLASALGKVIVGQREVVDHVLLALVAGGHVLLEGAPGLGKTLLVRTLALCVKCSFSRVQFTPDLMPADITGTNIVIEERGQRAFKFQPGPVFSNILLADEINRATPKTQSALLEAMAEAAVTVSGTRHALPEPFFVLATQNPIEMEGTYPLPEAQLDRFLLKVNVPFPTEAELAQVIDRTSGTHVEDAQPVIDGKALLDFRALSREVILAPEVRDFAARIVLLTHPTHPKAPENVRRFVRYGASPRGAQALILVAKVRALRAGRPHVNFDDVRETAVPALRHRLIQSFEGEASGTSAEALVKEAVAAAK